MSTDTKTRIIAASGALMRRQGYAGTGMKQILALAGAVPASAYHHFPGGKPQIAEAAIRANGGSYFELIDACFAGRTDLAAAIRVAFEGAAATLEAFDFADACPIATIALEVAGVDDHLRAVTGEVFESWLVRIEGHFRVAGLAEAEARSLAVTVLTALEGGFMLARATRTAEPLRVLARTVSTLAP